MIESGTVHAIGAGAMIVEIQESSNLTYRMYDYHRLGKDGKPRELHIAKALDVVDLRQKPLPEQLQRACEEHDGYSVELLEQCKYFRTERLRLDTVKSVAFATGSESFEVLLCVDGSGTLRGEDVELSFRKGDCIFVPADSIGLEISGQSELLKVTC